VLRRALTAAALAACVVLPGCSTAEGQRAQELLLQAQAAEAQLKSAAFDASLSFALGGEKVEVLLEGAGAKDAQYLSVTAGGMPGLELDAKLVVRGRTAWVGMNGEWERTQVPAGLDLGTSASFGSAAFQELTKHVRDVRVTEQQIVAGKPATIIAGEIDTVGLMGSLTKLAGLGQEAAPEGFELPDLNELGVTIGDIKAVLTIDESTRLMSAALVTLAIEAGGEQLHLELRYRLTAANEPVKIPAPRA
jgi:hypothetical protein